MAIAKVKTWSTVDCRTVLAATSRANHAKLMFYHAKEILKALGWVVVGSSDSTAADSIVIGSHGTDRWTAPSKCVIVVSSGAHSWLVIENPSLYSHYQLCIDLIGGTEQNRANLYCSPSGQYSGGSTTAKPTATDEISWGARYWWFEFGWDAVDMFIAGVGSSDGQCTRLFAFDSSVGTLGSKSAAIFFDRVQGAPSWWTEKYVMTNYFGSGYNFMRAKFSAEANLKAMINTVTPANIRGVRATFEATSAGMLPAIVATDYGGTPVVSPVGLCIDSTAQRGFLGSLYDAYWINPNQPNCSALIGTGGAWDWIKWGDAIFGWNGSVPVWNTYSYV